VRRVPGHRRQARLFSCLALPVRPSSTLRQPIDDSLSTGLDWARGDCRRKQAPEITAHCGSAPAVAIAQLVRFRLDRGTKSLAMVHETVDVVKEAVISSETGPATCRLSGLIVHQGRRCSRGTSWLCPE
jgi:hypothetical protein